MLKKLLLTMVVLAMTTSMVVADTINTDPADPVGVFQHNQDIGGPAGIGLTVQGVYPDSDDYLVQGGGGDIWGTWDQFHMAYNLVEGNARVSADFAWQAKGNNDWSKMGVMVRDSAAGDAINYKMVTRRDENKVVWEYRPGTGSGSSGYSWDTDATNIRFGIQRINSGAYTVIQGLYDAGSGWEVYGMGVNPALSDEVLLGVAVTSHDNRNLVQARVSNVLYENDVDLIGVPTLDATPNPDQCSDIPGFRISVMVPASTDGWGYDAAVGLFKGTTPPGILIPALAFRADRVDPVVNMRDTGNGQFGDDRSYPGIDMFEFPANDPADGDDDNNFATQAVACIYLTQGLHIIGVASDDGTIIKIGGVELGRTIEWKGANTVDFPFVIAQEGWYDFQANTHEGGGGASFELHEVLPDGTRILLGARDDQGNFIGSPVYVPEPATIALLGLGGLSLLRRKRS